jgi:hypothetical protein
VYEAFFVMLKTCDNANISDDVWNIQQVVGGFYYCKLCIIIPIGALVLLALCYKLKQFENKLRLLSSSLNLLLNAVRAVCVCVSVCNLYVLVSFCERVTAYKTNPLIQMQSYTE